MSNGGFRQQFMRSIREAAYVNTINVQDRLTIDFVWYPGESPPAVTSLVGLFVPAIARGEVIQYEWIRQGHGKVRRPLAGGRITLALPRGARGELKVFDTTWRIVRVGVGVNMAPVNTMRGVQQRLNTLGYDLRRLGKRSPGTDNLLGPRTERAILHFQTDYSPPAGAPAAAANRLRLRGEWTSNPGIQANLDTYSPAPPAPNPSNADGATFRAALTTLVP